MSFTGSRISGMESKMSRLQLSAPEEPTADDQESDDNESDYECEYSEDIWKNLLQQETEKPQMHLTSPQLEFRGTLVSQMKIACRRLGLTRVTLHAAVQLLDLFMDRHDMREDRLAHSAVACLSLAAKSEEKFNRAPRFSVLSEASGLAVSELSFRKLEWMVGQHVRWRLLMPTAATFAGLLSGHVIGDDDLVSRDPRFMRRFRRDGRRLLESYLDLSLSDVRLKVMDGAEVGCACVACARAALGLAAWPPRLATVSGHAATRLAPVCRLLHGMMRILKSREKTEEDLGYSSAVTTPSLTPAASPDRSPATRHQTDTTVVRRDQLPVQTDYKQELEIKSATNTDDYPYYRSRRLIEASVELLEGKGVKRSACRDLGFQIESKRHRVDNQRLL